MGSGHAVVVCAKPVTQALREQLVLDTSAVLAVLRDEPERRKFNEAIEAAATRSLSTAAFNAAKYTDVGGRITLTATLDEAQQLTITVADSGIGLSAQTIPRLFEMFSQVESPMDRAEGGLGIGLALVKGLVELHGGTVEAISAGLGHGSRFTIRLPAYAVSRRRVTESAGGGTKSVPLPRQGLRILLADDNRDAVDSLALVLKMAGYEVHATHSGLAALEVGARVQPDVFILDIGMPEISGYELAARIREQLWGQTPLLIALTGWGQQEDKERSRGAGFDHHLTKPVDPDQLERLLREFAPPPAGYTRGNRPGADRSIPGLRES